MIEISGFIHQLYVSETEEKKDYGKTIAEANCHSQCRYATDDEKEIRIIAKRLNPFKSVIGKIEVWLDVKLVYPIIRPKSNNAQ